MYKKNEYKIISNKKIANLVYEMILEGDTQYITKPGQFINIELKEFYLRRPISISDYSDNTITIVYKVLGEGTEKLSQIQEGTLDILTGLGNGFDVRKSKERPLLIGGGVGTPPMYGLCKKLIEEGKKPIVVLGFNSKEDVFYEDKFKALGADVYVSTVDGSYGTKGFVTDIIKTLDDYDFYYACGPINMLKAVHSLIEKNGELSLEERMGCGIGACMGCTINTKTGPKRVCYNGPVFSKEDLLW